MGEDRSNTLPFCCGSYGELAFTPSKRGQKLLKTLTSNRRCKGLGWF